MRRCVLVLSVLVGLAAAGGCSGKDTASDAAPAAATVASAAPTVTGPPPASPTADVSRVAPALDTYFRTNGYPSTLEGVADAMPKANLAMDPTNAIAGYHLDATLKQFRLCVESDSGTWATYNTSPMAVDDHGVTGGCPQF
jgi:hypothetical protein